MEESIWENAEILNCVSAALREAKPAPNGSGLAYLTAYQLAIKVDRDHPEVRQALGVKIGGEGTGSHVSFAQYLGRELSRRSRSANFPVEMVYLSNDHVADVTYKSAGGEPIVSSLTGTGIPLALFRWRGETQAS
ncbi:hypothetical protein [Kutzneria sp. NPDC051319]|uniref:hypothetical protein n=1 Tax=Kutzneria sp. NPDC051319 TaxID=3155047 RepID=UPI003426EC30